LNELDRIAIGIGDPRRAQLAVKKVMGRREKRDPLCNQAAHCGIGVVSPKDDFDPAPFSSRGIVVSLLHVFENSFISRMK
jgi:hypothetical protein